MRRCYPPPPGAPGNAEVLPAPPGAPGNAEVLPAPPGAPGNAEVLPAPPGGAGECGGVTRAAGSAGECGGVTRATGSAGECGGVTRAAGSAGECGGVTRAAGRRRGMRRCYPRRRGAPGNAEVLPAPPGGAGECGGVTRATGSAGECGGVTRATGSAGECGGVTRAAGRRRGMRRCSPRPGSAGERGGITRATASAGELGGGTRPVCAFASNVDTWTEASAPLPAAPSHPANPCGGVHAAFKSCRPSRISHAGARRTFGRAASAPEALIRSKAFLNVCTGFIGSTPFFRGSPSTHAGRWASFPHQRNRRVKAHPKIARNLEIIRVWELHRRRALDSVSNLSTARTRGLNQNGETGPRWRKKRAWLNGIKFS